MTKASSELVLLDVNVLLALAWPNHQFHAAADHRFADRRIRWATCVVTQLGFIRLSSHPAVVSPAKTPAQAAALLAGMTSDPNHVFLPSVAAGKIERFDTILGAQQVTDVYLLAVARRHHARLVTFDRRLSRLAASPEHVEVLA